ncbi:hypothetical protein [Enterobacter sp. PTB]|uniref:hypothetical protein n=1 Tax=Enterobacter sp. PTB TaxID=3143437 RepID=UPI003DA9FBE8
MNSDILNIIVLPIILYLLKKIIDGIPKIIIGSQQTKQQRFNKIPIDQKVKIIEEIDILKGKALTPHTLIQMRFLYEQMGVYLPVWHSHKLISFLASEEIGSLDVRLNVFLKRTFITRCATGCFSINKKSFWLTLLIYFSFGSCSAAAFIYYGYFILHYFLQNEKNTLFNVFFCGDFISVCVIVAYVTSQIGELWQGMRFGRRFEDWLQDEHADIPAERAITTAASS